MILMDIYDEILSTLESDAHLILATIISTTGSTPAATLSKMLVKKGGIISVGTVGGGCMEGEVLMHAHRIDGTGRAEILTFHLNEDDIEHGLICGGSLDVLIEPVTRSHIPLIRTLQSIRDEGNDSILATHLRSDGTIGAKQVISGGASVSQLAMDLLLPPLHFGEIAQKALHRQETVRIAVTDGEVILEPVFGRPSLIIFGGGHVSKYVSRIAALCGFRITIVDDREKFANTQRFPEATRTIVADFLEAFPKLTVNASSYILIVTRGHRYDTAILEEAIKTPARYIGMIGSKRKVLSAFEYLRQHGVPEERLQQVHSPVGMNIGAVSAEEIAVSIVAEIITIRRGSGSSFLHKSDDLWKSLSEPRKS